MHQHICWSVDGQSLYTDTEGQTEAYELIAALVDILISH